MQRFGKPDELNRIAEAAIPANQHMLIAEIFSSPNALEMTVPRMLDCAGPAILNQASLAYFPSTLKNANS
jgi:hypothetical protein